MEPSKEIAVSKLKKNGAEDDVSLGESLSLLPDELWLHVFSFLEEPKDFFKIIFVSKYFCQLATDEVFFGQLFKRHFRENVQYYKTSEIETHRYTFFKILKEYKLKNHTFMVCYSTNQSSYDPLTFLNYCPIAVIPALAYGPCPTIDEIHEKLKNRPLPKNKNLRGIRYILEFKLGVDTVQSKLAASQHGELLKHLIRVHPDLHTRRTYGETAHTLSIEYHPKENKFTLLGEPVSNVSQPKLG